MLDTASTYIGLYKLTTSDISLLVLKLIRLAPLAANLKVLSQWLARKCAKEIP
jgi:hypothetical protein